MALLQSNGTIDGMQMNVIDIKLPSMITRSDRMLLQIESIRKTETGFLCEFSDRANRIFGTLSKFN